MDTHLITDRLTNFIPISEAVTLTGKSLNTIRRLIKKQPKNSPDILLSGSKYLISKELLFSVYPLIDNDEYPGGNQNDNTEVSNMSTQKDSWLPNEIAESYKETIEILRGELDSKNEVIKGLQEANKDLIERNREQNILIQSSIENSQKLLDTNNKELTQRENETDQIVDSLNAQVDAVNSVQSDFASMEGKVESVKKYSLVSILIFSALVTFIIVFFGFYKG